MEDYILWGSGDEIQSLFLKRMGFFDLFLKAF
jgi:hypothetical protein